MSNTPTDEDLAKARERFWAKVEKGPGCWEWRGSKNHKGYGRCWRGNRRYATHRLAYAMVNGPVPKGLHVCHTCDNPSCVRPDHLFAGTNAQNIQQAWDRGRGRNQNIGRTHCCRGHALSGDNLWVTSVGKRACRKCKNARNLRYWHRKGKARRDAVSVSKGE